MIHTKKYQYNVDISDSISMFLDNISSAVQKNIFSQSRKGHGAKHMYNEFTLTCGAP